MNLYDFLDTFFKLTAAPLSYSVNRDIPFEIPLPYIKLAGLPYCEASCESLSEGKNLGYKPFIGEKAEIPIYAGAITPYAEAASAAVREPDVYGRTLFKKLTERAFMKEKVFNALAERVFLKKTVYNALNGENPANSFVSFADGNFSAQTLYSGNFAEIAPYVSFTNGNLVKETFYKSVTGENFFEETPYGSFAEKYFPEETPYGKFTEAFSPEGALYGSLAKAFFPVGTLYGDFAETHFPENAPSADNTAVINTVSAKTAVPCKKALNTSGVWLVPSKSVSDIENTTAKAPIQGLNGTVNKSRYGTAASASLPTFANAPEMNRIIADIANIPQSAARTNPSIPLAPLYQKFPEPLQPPVTKAFTAAAISESGKICAAKSFVSAPEKEIIRIRESTAETKEKSAEDLIIKEIRENALTAVNTINEANRINTLSVINRYARTDTDSILSALTEAFGETAETGAEGVYR